MSLFSALFGKIFPLYPNIGLGYLAARLLRADRSAIASLLFYLFGPAVLLQARPEKAALAVLISTLVSLATIPLLMTLYESFELMAVSTVR